MLPACDHVLTAIVGSYPKPRYIYPRGGRALLDSFGFAFERRREEVGAAEFARLLDRAAREAIEDQNRAGIDIVTDGEERRGHYVLHIVNRLCGVDARNLKPISMRAGTSQQNAPRVIGKLGYEGPLVLEEFLFTKRHARGLAKIGLPGPSTVADCVADEYYEGNRKRLAFDYADAIRHEVAALIAAGCEVVQFDDPVLLRYPEAAQAWGVEALERCFAGFEGRATFIVHICRGYPNKPLERKGIAYKADQNYYRDILSWLALSRLDRPPVEEEAHGADLLLEGLPGLLVLGQRLGQPFAEAFFGDLFGHVFLTEPRGRAPRAAGERLPLAAAQDVVIQQSSTSCLFNGLCGASPMVTAIYLTSHVFRT